MDSIRFGHKPVTWVDVSPTAVERETTVLVALLTGQVTKAAEPPRLGRSAVRRIEGPVEAAA